MRLTREPKILRRSTLILTAPAFPVAIDMTLYGIPLAIYVSYVLALLVGVGLETGSTLEQQKVAISAQPTPAILAVSRENHDQ
jgi:hypothetical protein